MNSNVKLWSIGFTSKDTGKLITKTIICDNFSDLMKGINRYRHALNAKPVYETLEVRDYVTRESLDRYYVINNIIDLLKLHLGE
jgi:hypothetical protein